MAGDGTLIVNLEEFADLCGVTGETMRVHIRTVEGNPAWLVERGDRGRGYKIEAEGGLAWWQAKKEADDLADAERRAQLQQMRLNLVGDQAEDGERLQMSGRQRREEYAAAFEALKYRKMMGELIEKVDLEHALTAAAVEMRRRLGMVPGEFAILTGLDPEQVKPLENLLARAMDDFVKAITPEETLAHD